MKFHEKIYYCRKKAGLSQEGLAEIIGVSRQAVSKWETADAVPELSKLPLLAKAFNVTADWLLSEDEPTENISQTNCRTDGIGKFDELIGRIAEFAEKAFRKHCWLLGVFLALLGTYRVVILAFSMFSNINIVPDNFIMMSLINSIIGFIMIIAGIILAVKLRKWCKSNL